jgi:hypothetical protein
MRVISARTQGLSVILRLDDGSCIERDFSLVRGGTLDRIHTKGGLDRRVRIAHNALVWHGEIDFGLDTIVWGFPRVQRRRPLKRAMIGAQGALIPSPLVRELR